MSGLAEGAVAVLLKELLREVAGAVRRRLSGSPVQAALRTALSEALEAALNESGLSPEDFDHYEGFFNDLFKQEAVLVELAQLLDPRPDVSLDFKKLAAELEEAGLDPETLPGFELETFLHNFAVAFYSAVGKQEALRDILDLKLLGQVAVGVRTIAEWSQRGALASERTADGVERLTGEVEELNRNLQRFVEGGMSEAAALRGAVLALQAAGLIPAFDGWRSIESTLLKSGYDIDIDKEGRLKIAGQPSEGRALPPAQLDTLRNLAVDLRQAIAARSPSEAELDALADRYRQHIIRWFQNLTFHGMTPSARAIELPLEEVYVELRAVAEVPEAADSFSVEERRLLLEAEDKDPEAKRELLSQLDAFRRERWGRTLPERKSIAAALYQKDRRAFVILGDPGSGKSTLLHFLALVHALGSETAGRRLGIDPAEADRLPILVPLAAFDDMLRETPGLTLLDFLPRFYDRRRGLPGLGPLFRRALETGSALVLLDGLDEVLDTATRGYVTQQASAMIGEWSPRGVRFAVSSRFVGYREAPVPGSLPTLSVLDFGEKEIEIFVHRWSHAYEKWSAGGETPEMLRKARELERDLLDDVKSNESVRRLAANPLMITLLALLRRQVGRLPHRRVQLYEAYVSTMLDNWIEARSQGAREKSIPSLDRHQAENILIPMALWLQREKPSGTAGGAELERQLTDLCLVDKGTSRESSTRPQLREAEEHARRFLKEMRETTGLLIARGHDAFGFLHLTFQEYFAGRALALLDPEERWSLLRPHLHNPRWREPILLCAGRLGVVENRRKDVTDLVRRILKYEDPTEPHLRRNMLLALAIACDDVNLDRSLLEDLMDAAVQSFSNKVNALRTQVLGYLAQMTAEGETKARLDRCFAAVWASGDAWFQRLAVQALGRFAENPEIREVLLSKLEDQSPGVRSAAVEGLGGVAEEDERVRRALLSKIGDNDEDIRSEAVRSLTGLLADDEEVRTAIFTCLEDPSLRVAGDARSVLLPHVRRFRAALLAKIEGLDELRHPRIVITLTSVLLESDEELRTKMLSLVERGKTTVIRSSALEALSGLVGERPKISAIFVEAARSPDLAQDAFFGLAPFLDTIEEAREIALARLQHENEWIRQSAVQILSRFVTSDQTFRHAIYERLVDTSPAVRSAAIQALSSYSDLPEIRAFRMLAESEHWDERRVIAQIVGDRIASSEDFPTLRSIRDNINASEASQFLARSLGAISELPGGRELLLAYINDTRSNVRLAATQALASRAKEDPVIHAAIVKLIDGEEPEVWGVLGPLVEWDRDVRSKMLDRIDHPDKNMRLAALRSLSSSAGKDEEIAAAILLRAKDDNYAVRSLVASALAPVLGRSQEARRAILDLLDDANTTVRWNAARAMSELSEEDREIQKAVLCRFEEEPAHSRQHFIEVLSKPVRNNPEIRDRILRELRDEKSSSRGFACIALGGLAAEDEDIRGLILDQMASLNPIIRQSGVKALSHLVGANAEVRAAILARLDDSWFFVRLQAVKALVTLEAAQLEQEDLWVRLEPWLTFDTNIPFLDLEQARPILASVFGVRLHKDQDLQDRMIAQLQSVRWSARLGALLTLSSWPGGPPQEIVERIFQALNDQRGLESYPARLTAASFLINRNEDAEPSIAVCMEALDYGTEHWEFLSNSGGVRKQASLILGKLEPLEHNQRVYDRLLRVMEEDTDPSVRDAAYNALVRLAGVRDRQAAVV